MKTSLTRIAVATLTVAAALSLSACNKREGAGTTGSTGSPSSSSTTSPSSTGSTSPGTGSAAGSGTSSSDTQQRQHAGQHQLDGRLGHRFGQQRHIGRRVLRRQRHGRGLHAELVHHDHNHALIRRSRRPPARRRPPQPFSTGRVRSRHHSLQLPA